MLAVQSSDAPRSQSDPGSCEDQPAGVQPQAEGEGSVLVTGASGFIGRHVVRHLLEQGRSVLALEHRWPSRATLERSLGEQGIEACIHLGWYADPRDYLSADVPNLESLRASIELIAALVSRGVVHLTVAGTSAEYAPSTRPLHEEAELSTATPYGRAKGALRELTTALAQASVLPTAWCRIFNLTGRGEHQARLIPQVICALLRGEPIELSDGGQQRDFLDVRDVAAALSAASTSRLVGSYNVCSGRPVVLRDLLVDIARRCGPLELLRFGARARRACEPDIVIGDGRKLERAAGWRPSIAWQSTLEDCVDYWRSEIEQR